MIRMHRWLACLSVALVVETAAQRPDLSLLPAVATSQLARSLAAATAHRGHVWRDTVPVNGDGTVNAYVEIARGDRRKWELDMAANERAIDRVMPVELGGYPVNYGFVPQTVSYDGDPFDALVLGPAITGGRTVRGAIVGLMLMDDEKGHDAKVVLSPVGGDGQPLYRLGAQEQRTIGGYFDMYKRHETGKFSRVPGWESAATGRAYVMQTHAFFRDCRERAGLSCQVSPQTRSGILP
jgi:inorganic pyrophosphatase